MWWKEQLSCHERDLLWSLPEHSNWFHWSSCQHLSCWRVSADAFNSKKAEIGFIWFQVILRNSLRALSSVVLIKTRLSFSLQSGFSAAALLSPGSVLGCVKPVGISPSSSVRDLEKKVTSTHMFPEVGNEGSGHCVWWW